MPSVVAIIFFSFWISYPTRNSARPNKREGPRQAQTQTQRRKGRPAGGSRRLLAAPPRGVGVQEVCGTMQLCGETPNKPPWKGAEDSGFFFFPKKGARRPAGAREAAPHRPPPGKGANGTLRGRSPRTPEGVAHGHPDKRRRLGSRRRRRPPVHRGRGSRRLRPTEGSVEAPQARKHGPGTRPRSPTSGCPSKGRDVAVWRRDASPVPGGRAPLLGRAAVRGRAPPLARARRPRRV